MKKTIVAHTGLLTEMFKFLTISLVIALAFPDLAMAAADLGAVADSVNRNVGKFPDLIAGTSFACGLGMGVMGIIDLKKHADSPQNNPMSKGVGKLAGCAALVALGPLASVTNKTLDQQGNVSFQGGLNY
ncbi:MAG: hypothetical protein EBZ69_04665 [Alphaproteobacteria bacterium]|nr:hypothetical protein [Alphaproteobacteria bacterium]NDC56088.1 hypothetical protein [Alphaproteobacteria bacterium]